MKYYDKSMYQTEQHVRIIVTILIAFIIGFLIGYWCRGTELINTKTEEKGILEKELKEEMPQFSGGSVQLWIKENLRYPEIARENNIQGKVYVKCIIDSEGNVCNAEIQRGVDPSLNKEALRLVNSMPKWKPGMQNGKTVSIPYVIIVEFKLN